MLKRICRTLRTLRIARHHLLMHTDHHQATFTHNTWVQNVYFTDHHDHNITNINAFYFTRSEPKIEMLIAKYNNKYKKIDFFILFLGILLFLSKKYSAFAKPCFINSRELLLHRDQDRGAVNTRAKTHYTGEHC